MFRDYAGLERNAHLPLESDLRRVAEEVLRWLLPLIAVMTLLGSSVTAWAAAGFFGESSCCCPVKAKCKCHDHDDPSPWAKMKRCGGDAERVDPAVTPIVAAAQPPLAIDVDVAVIVTAADEPIPDDQTIEPETPPF